MTPDAKESTSPTDEPSKKSSANHPAATNDKVMVLAVGLLDGKFAITPFDLEFETDDQSPLSKAEHTLFKRSQAKFDQHRHGLEQALQALHPIFAERLYREKFASFEKYCFALQGMALPEDKLNKLKAKANNVANKLGNRS
jgi:hypothetical protein